MILTDIELVRYKFIFTAIEVYRDVANYLKKESSGNAIKKFQHNRRYSAYLTLL